MFSPARKAQYKYQITMTFGKLIYYTFKFFIFIIFTVRKCCINYVMHVCICWSENNLKDLVHSFHHICPGE